MRNYPIEKICTQSPLIWMLLDIPPAGKGVKVAILVVVCDFHAGERARDLGAWR
jgi:hypothetical protein